MEKKILFVLQLVGHPRDSKRISMLQREGFQLEALAFERDYHKGRLPSCKVSFIGKLQHGRYFFRLLKILRAIPLIRKAIRRNEAVYASGQDVAFASYLAGVGLGRPIVMEVGDIVGIQVRRGFWGKICRFLDRIVTSRYSSLVVISQGFLETYYRKWLGITIPALVIENKLSGEDFPQKLSCYRKSLSDEMPLADRPIRIGYFGLLRDDWSWRVLSKLARNYPEKFEIVFAGYPVNPINISELVNDFSNMSFHGEYKSPGQLPEIYERVDMVWSCYPEIKSDDWNLKWGRPNRFYESCFFGKPCFAREGSLFAEDVKKFNLGCIIDDVDVSKVVKQISAISMKDLNVWSRSVFELPTKIFMYSQEGKDLASMIRNL